MNQAAPTTKSLAIFDLDGTLVNSAPDIATAINGALQSMGHASQTDKQVSQWMGSGSAMLVKRALGHVLETDPDDVNEKDFERGHQLFFENYRQCNGERTTLFPEVQETLEALQQNNIQMAVATNKPGEFTLALLKHLNLNSFFRCVVSGDTLTVKKPDPTPLIHCVEHCCTSVDQSLMVGDSMTDIKAAQNADMDVVAVSFGYNRGANLAEECTVLNRFSELTQHLLG